MNERRVTSWNELQDALYADAWREQIKRFRSPYVYRGLSDTHYPLKTSLMRLGGNYQEMEQHLLRNFRKYAHRDIVERDTLWHWLSLAQHHGLPTRLLDWTVSPLVAAHFATANTEKFHCDGAIWAVDYRKTHHLLPNRFQRALAEEGAEFFTVELLAHLVESLEDLDQIQPEPFQLFFEPPSIDDRIINQFALFSVMAGETANPNQWLQDHSGLWCKIIIPAELKWEIRDRLDQANITERVLFPGLDGLSRWQKRYYTPRE